MTNFLDLMPAADAAVNLAASFLRTRQPGILTGKGDRDMATEVDYAIERQVRAFLSERTPNVGFLGEEEGSTGTADDLVWVLDPIDGTANFIHGSPLCGISLGLLHQGQPVLGVVDFPFLDARYAAVRGHGAHHNGQPIFASSTSRLREAMVAIGDYAVGDGAERRNLLRLAITHRLAAQVQRVRMHGSAAIDLTWLACGRLDAVIIMSNKPWDMAAGVVIAREAGAEITDSDGSLHDVDSSATIGAAPRLIADVLKLISEAESDLTPAPAKLTATD